MARNIGLKNIYVAEVTKNTETEFTTSTPIKLARAISAKVTEKFSTENSYSDDALDEIIRCFDSMEIELDVNKLTLEKKALLYGKKYEMGMLTSNINDIAKDISIGFMSKNSDGTYDFTWVYVCRATDGDSKEYKTLEGKPSVGSDKIKLVARGREKDGNYKVDVNENELIADNADAKALAKVDKWFTKVTEPLEAV